MDLFGNKPLPNRAPGFKSYNPYAAGSKRYGGGRSMPNIGPVSGQGQLGYDQRDNQASARKAAILKRLKAQKGGNPLNPKLLQSDLNG